MADFVLRRGQTTPIFTATIVDINGTVVNLNGGAGSVKFVARQQTSSAAAINASATIISASAGTVSYTPTAADTAVAGHYTIEWQYTLLSGATGTYPADGYQGLLIEEALSDVGNPRLVNLG